MAQRTDLPDAVVDIVTCSQSLHHLELESTLREVARVLKPGGVFAAYDYDRPPTVHPDAERALAEFLDRARGLRRSRGIASGREQWDKADHLARLQRSGIFRSAEEMVLQTPQAAGSEGAKLKSGGRAWNWAALMHRAFAIDVLACPRCGGRLRLIATVYEPAVIRKLLAHLGMARSGPSPGPAPPESGGIAS